MMLIKMLMIPLVILPGLGALGTCAAAQDTEVPVTFSGGRETAGEDRGRPVILVASALGVSAEVFRAAFSHVHPAPAGEQPGPDQVRRNKTALMEALAPYGVTNERLDEVSNYYRYRREDEELWRNAEASVVALVSNGVVTGFRVISGGAGYSSEPNFSVPGFKRVTAKVTLWFGKDLARNGSVAGVELVR